MKNINTENVKFKIYIFAQGGELERKVKAVDTLEEAKKYALDHDVAGLARFTCGEEGAYAKRLGVIYEL